MMFACECKESFIIVECNHAIEEKNVNFINVNGITSFICKQCNRFLTNANIPDRTTTV